MLSVMEQITSREQIAANVRAEMARRRVHQGDIARVIGKSRPSASDRVRGATHFRIDELQKIAAFLEVPLEQLLSSTPTAVR